MFPNKGIQIYDKDLLDDYCPSMDGEASLMLKAVVKRPYMFIVGDVYIITFEGTFIEKEQFPESLDLLNTVC